MKLRNSAGAGNSSNNASPGADLEFQALKDTVWRLTCRVVSLETELSEMKERFELAGFSIQRPPRSKRNFQISQPAENSVSGGLDPGDLLSVEYSQDQEGQETDPTFEIIGNSFSDTELNSEQDNLDVSNDSNFDTKRKVTEIKIWAPAKKQRRAPRFGPDGKREKDFECHICHRRFTRNEHLQDHIRTHQGNQFSCVTCGGTFAYKNALRRHEKYRCKTKQTLEQLTCKHCNKVFRGRKNLGIHMRVHSEKKAGLGSRSSAPESTASLPDSSVSGGVESSDHEPEFIITHPTKIEYEDEKCDEAEAEDDEGSNHQINQIIQENHDHDHAPVITSVVSQSHMDFTDMIQL